MEQMPTAITILFVLTTIITVWLLFKAANYSKKLILVVGAWIAIQCILGSQDFYTNWDAVPPRFFFLIFPPILFIIIMFNTVSGKKFIDSLDIRLLTILHTIRIAVEVVLYFTFVEKLVPRSVTFEGSNFDILSGITAPIIYYLVFIFKLNKQILLFWNFACLILLLNVVITAILSAKTPLQQFAFDQPVKAVGLFPFNLLPAVIVPIVLFSHLAVCRRLIREF